MAARGRPAGFRMDDSHRTKISNSKILNRLIDFASGKEGVDISATQAAVGIALLKKVLPDLTNVQVSGDSDNPLRIIGKIELVPGLGNGKG